MTATAPIASYTEVSRSRRWARTIGWFVYWGCRPCRHGHVGWRYTKTANCVRCTLEGNRRRYFERRAVTQGVNDAT